MQLTTENVEKTLRGCLISKDAPNIPKTWKEARDMGFVCADGVHLKIAFQPELLEQHRSDIEDMISQLNDELETANGASFMDMDIKRDGTQWASFHKDMDALLVLGLAINKLEYVYPKDKWYLLPGNMPFIRITK